MMGGGGYTIPTYDLYDNLMCYWKLDEASNGSGAVSRHDVLGNQNMTDYKTTASASGRISNGANFIAANNETLYSDTTVYGRLAMGARSFEICAWVKLTSLADGRIIAKDRGSGAREWIVNYQASTDRFRALGWFGASAGTIKLIDAETLGAVSTGVWYFVDVTFDSPNQLLGISINRGAFDTVATGSAICVPNNASVAIGSYWTGGESLSNLDGIVDEVGIWKNRLLTETERDFLYNSGNGNTIPIDAKTRLVFEGDSMTLGTNPAAQVSYPSQVSDLFVPRPGWFNLGTDGDTMNNILATQGADADWLYGGTTKNVLCLWIGSNDILTGGRSAADIWADIKTYCAARKVTGWKTIVLTLTPKIYTGWDASHDAIQATLNASILGGDASIDVVADVASIAVLANPANATYYQDGLHLTTAGYAAVAALVAPLI
jgi:lysophospholipase L1-like esterase